jgi:RAB protein geranylgeranyltransferase component A
VVHIDKHNVYGGSLAALKPNAMIQEYLQNPKARIYVQQHETWTSLKSLDHSCLMDWKVYLPKIPKIVYCSGPLIQEIISSGCHAYLEFQKMDKIFYQTTLVPHTKEDVFSNPSISLVEKRKLMKFMTLVSHLNGNETMEGTFFDFLEYHQVPSSMIPIFLYAICLMRNEKDAKECNLQS